MKLTDGAAEALKHPDTRTKPYPMTPERKERMRVAAHAVIDLLKEKAEDPFEAYFTLKFALDAMESAYGIRGGIILENDDQVSA